MCEYIIYPNIYAIYLYNFDDDRIIAFYLHTTDKRRQIVDI